MSEIREGQKVLFYVPSHLVKGGYPYSQLMSPFWGIPKNEKKIFFQHALEMYGYDGSYYDITDDEQGADAILMPYSYWFLKKRDPDLIEAYIRESKKIGKKLLIDATGDNMASIDIDNAIVLRYASYRSRLDKHDILIPLLVEDLLETYQDVKFLENKKSDTAKISFSGWVSLPFKKYYKTYIKYFALKILSICAPHVKKYMKGVFLRRKILKLLEKSKDLETNFVKRESYSGHTETVSGDIYEMRKEFVENMAKSDYALCVRGDANQSARFYEALSLGKIPIFIDTDIPLPLEDKIDYHSFCLFVDLKDIKNISKIVADFHRSISAEQFESMQRESRHAFERFLRIDKFTPYLMNEILKRAV